jgi:hypothetical protein
MTRSLVRPRRSRAEVEGDSLVCCGWEREGQWPARRRDEKDPSQPGSTRDRHMAKKSKRSKRHQHGLAFPRLLEQQVSRAQQQMLQGDFPGTIFTCEPLLSSLPRRSSLRAEVLILLGLAHSMLLWWLPGISTEKIDNLPPQLSYSLTIAMHIESRVGERPCYPRHQLTDLDANECLVCSLHQGK